MARASLEKTRLVMVLEDETMIASLITTIIEDHGWSVGGPFRTNRESLEWLESERPDAALMDFNIADGNSALTARRLRELGIPFVVLSGYPKSMARHEELQAAPWLEKPFSEESVLRALNEALEACAQLREKVALRP
jgi:CheY-like chemotaxis protein